MSSTIKTFMNQAFAKVNDTATQEMVDYRLEHAKKKVFAIAKKGTGTLEVTFNAMPAGPTPDPSQNNVFNSDSLSSLEEEIKGNGLKIVKKQFEGLITSNSYVYPSKLTLDLEAN